MMSEVPYAIFIICIVLLSLWMANYFYDNEIKHWVSRKVGHLGGSVAYILSAFLFSSWVWPVILSSGFAILLLSARLIRPSTFRGVGGTGRRASIFAEIWFPVIGTAVLLVGWAWLNNPFAAVACILFMGVGDAVTGLVRSQVSDKEQKHLLGSVAMLITCLLIAWCFVSPVWIGVIAAFAVTITEYLCGNVSRIRWLRWADDNLMIPLVGAAVIFPFL